MFKKRQLSETAADISGTDALAAMCIPADAAEARALSAHPSSYRLSSFPPCPTPQSPPSPNTAETLTTAQPPAASTHYAAMPLLAPPLASPQAAEAQVLVSPSSRSLALASPLLSPSESNAYLCPPPACLGANHAAVNRSSSTSYGATSFPGFYPSTVVGGHTTGASGSGATPLISVRLQQKVSDYDCPHNDSPFGHDEPVHDGIRSFMRNRCSGGRVAASAVLLCVFLIIVVGGLLMVA